MTKIVKIVGISLVLLVILTACAPAAAPAPAPQAPAAAPAAPAPAAPAAAAPAKAAWEAEWEKVVAAAGKEGVVTVLATRPQFRTAWGQGMKNYGVAAEVVVGKGGDTAAKLLAERRAGIYNTDVYTGGTTTPLTQLKPGGVFDPFESSLILPEVKDPKNWFEGRLPFLDKDHLIFVFLLGSQPILAVNTNLVKAGEIQSYNDLLNPKWSGKVLINDPTATGTVVPRVLADVIMGWDWMRKLADTKPQILRDERLQVTWLAQGKAAIVIGPKDSEVFSFQEIGAPIDVVIPKEGGYLSCGPGSAALVNKAPHPNAARLFINWMLSKEGQTATSKAGGVQSARMDTPTDHLHPLVVRDPAKKYFVKEQEDFLLKEPEYFKLAKEVFRDLVK